MGVRPYVALFRQFFILVKSGRSKDELGAYYFQARAVPSTSYIPAFASGKWDLWRTEWVIARADANERLDLPTSEPASDRKAWRAKPSLPSEFDPVLEKIKALAEGGLTLMHVVGDFLNHRITPLQQRSRMAWSYTGSNDCSRVQRGEDADLTQEELEVMVQGMTGGRLHSGSSDPSQSITPLCKDQRLRTVVLASLPTLDNPRRIREPIPARRHELGSIRAPGQAAYGRRLCPRWIQLILRRLRAVPERSRHDGGGGEPAQAAPRQWVLHLGAHCEASEGCDGRG